LIDGQAQKLRLAQSRGELRLRKEPAKIRQRSGRRRDGDAGSASYFTGREDAGSMDMMPARLRALPGTVTWTGSEDVAGPESPSLSRAVRSIPQSLAALVWLRTAPGPQASTAAIQIPSLLSPWWPTA
jgi:hypothetical protein